MPTCSAKISSAPLHTNHEENCGHDGKYNGYYRFNQDQLYDGEFFRDSMHGEGIYKWNDLAVYEGRFYSNFKEGYASLSLLDNSYFEGLFIKNKPFGPGILTYSNGRQDAGFWLGRKLVRLSRAVDYIIPRLAPTSAAKIKLLQFRRLIPLNEKNCDSVIDILKKTGCQVEPTCALYSNLIYDHRSIFFDKEVFEKTYFINFNKLSKEFMSDSTNWEISNGYSEEDAREKESKSQIRTIPGHCLCPQDVFVMEYQNTGDTDICDRESYDEECEMGILANLTKYGTIEGFVDEMDGIKSDLENLSGNFIEDEAEAEETTEDKSTVTQIVSWNRSEICTEMIKQIFRYRAFEEKLSFNLGKLMLGARTAFRRTGKLEQQCVHFLKMCSLGPAHIVKELLCSYEIDEELMDARGNNSLMFAAATDQHEVIDILLNYGVDVNTFNDESLTPLNLCLLRRLAQANGICNWEAAFLPKEIDKTMISETPAQEINFESPQSISSLDRIFGDGMSIINSITFDSYEKTSSFENIKLSLSEKALAEAKTYSSASHITLFKLFKSQRKQTLLPPDAEGETRKVQKYSSVSRLQGSDEATCSSEHTPEINIQIVPKSNKREEFEKSVQQPSTDKYLFGFTFEKKPNGEGNKGKTVSAKSNKGKASISQREEPKEENLEVERTLGSEITEKIAEIDKTIVKLLQRGADPNISEVPKPSIHLGVYTKDVNTVYTLLLFGASPDCQLYSNEGLLTPLHVVVLQKPAQEYVDICELLLKFGADPEKETDPEFSLCEEEKDFLSPEQGRTPLQLLCMRPDLEYVNLNDSLIIIGLMLAKVSDKRHFYKGHSCLTLAMRSNNLKLLEALLESKYYDPNEILEEDRGTALHFLLSTELQKNTTYETSTKICDLLIAAGANPLKKFKRPLKLKGTYTDYGYREIEAEKENRKLSTSGKKTEKIIGRDYLKDHEKVVGYLGAIALEMAKKKANKHGTGSRKKKCQEDSGRNDEIFAKSSDDKEESEENAEDTTGKDRIKDKRQKETRKNVNDDLKIDKSESEEDEGRKRLRFGETKKKNVKSEKEDEGEGEGKAKDDKSNRKDEDRDEDKDEGKDKGIKSKKKDKDRDEDKNIKSKKKDNGRDEDKDEDRDKGIKSKKKDNDREDDKDIKSKKKDKDRDDDKNIKSKKKDNGRDEDKDEDRDKGIKSKKKDNDREDDKDIKSKKKDKDRDEDKNIKSKKKDNGRDEDKDEDRDKGIKSKKKDNDREDDKDIKSKKKDKDRDDDKNIKSKKKDNDRDEDKEIKSKKKDIDKDAGKKSERDQPLREKLQVQDNYKISSKKDLERESKKPGSNLLKPTTSSSKNLSVKKSGNLWETFPERLRRIFLRLYGSCPNVDVNEFLVPYVVLRNGELYYRFQGKTNQKEQYSLI